MINFSGVTSSSPQQRFPTRPAQHTSATPSATTEHNQSEVAKTAASTGVSETERSKNTNDAQLTNEEHKQVMELKAIDREVHAHEAAHMAAAGGLAQGGARFSYTSGPDGRRYAVGGEVSIDTSSVKGNPQATLQKANTIRSAALAPAKPSSQDRAVAAQAAQMAAQARAEIMAQRLDTDTQADENRQVNHSGISVYEKIQQHTDAPSSTDALLNLVA